MSWHSTVRFLLVIIMGFIVFFLGACAKPYHLYVKYDLPQSSQDMKGKKVALKIVDIRDSDAILSEKARKEFDLWDETYALYLTEKRPEGDVETYNLTSIFKEALKKRTESMGVDVVEENISQAPILELSLKTFFLDLKDRTWLAEISYEAKLTKDNKKIAREQVSGKAERTKVMGKGGGEQLIGEIFTIGINKLDIQKLFENAGL